MKLVDLTPDQMRKLAVRAKTTLDYLRHLSRGRRQASADMAARLERASKGAIGRETLCDACRQCPYLKTCRNMETEK